MLQVIDGLVFLESDRRGLPAAVKRLHALADGVGPAQNGFLGLRERKDEPIRISEKTWVAYQR
jgi:hypothetical protein